MSRKRGREAIEERLRAWENELVTNHYQRAHLAPQIIADLKEQLARSAPPHRPDGVR